MESDPKNEIPKIKTIIKNVKGFRCKLLRFSKVRHNVCQAHVRRVRGRAITKLAEAILNLIYESNYKKM